MSPRKLLLLTAVVLVLFAFIVFFERKMPSTEERQQKGDLVWEIPQSRIESVRLEHGGILVELKKTEGSGTGWKIVKPETYPADSGAANDVASQLTQLRRAGTEIAEAKPEDYGLKTPAAKATIVWKDEANGKKLLSRTLELGIDIPGTDTTAARAAGSERVFFVPASVAAAVRKNPDDFKSKEVFGGSSVDVTRLDVERGRGRLSLSKKNGVWWLAQPLTDLADGDAVARLAGDLTGLKTVDFLPGADRQNLASLGLAPPLYRVTLADLNGVATTVDFGATRSDGNSIYARRETQVFTVGSAIAEELSKEAEAFRDPHLVRFDRVRAASVSGDFGGRSFALEHQASGWSSAGRPLTAAAVDDLFTAIADLKSRSFVDAGEVPKGHEPQATITVKSPEETWTVRLFSLRAEALATVSDRPGAFALSSDPTPSLQAAFQKATIPAPPTPAPKKK